MAYWIDEVPSMAYRVGPMDEDTYRQIYQRVQSGWPIDWDELRKLPNPIPVNKPRKGSLPDVLGGGMAAARRLPGS